MNPRRPFYRIISILLTFTLLRPELLFAQASYFALTSLPTPGVLRGNLTKVVDPDSSVIFTYDLAGRLTSTSTLNSPSQPAISLSYTYDKNNNRLSMFDPIGATNYLYDKLNRLTTLTNPHTKTTTFSYDALSRRTSLSQANGTSTSYSYDAASQLTSLTNLKGAATISKYDYTYDKTGNRTNMTETSPTVPAPGIHNYGYDVLNRLTSATHPQVQNPQESFGYDEVGNRLTSHLSTTYRYDPANRLLEDNSYLYTYDDNGNLIQRKERLTGAITTYTYEPENQLIAISLPDGGLAEYRYDGLGRRIEKNVKGVITRYIYDNEDILLEYDKTNTLIARYTHGPGIDEPLIMRRGTQDYFYHLDGLGSIKEITDSIGNITQSYTYDSFGRIVTQTGSLTNPYTYTGREFDTESGLYYYRARYYDARIGRFLQEDPIRLLGGINFYTYAHNNPIGYNDPFGLIVPGDPDPTDEIIIGEMLRRIIVRIPWDRVIQTVKVKLIDPSTQKIMRYIIDPVTNKTVGVFHEIWKKVGDIWYLIHRDACSPKGWFKP